MGGYISHICCTEKDYLLTTENFSSRLSSPNNAGLIRRINSPERKIERKSIVLKQAEVDSYSEFKRPYCKRALSNIENIDNKKADDVLGMLSARKGFRRSYTLKLKEKSNFLQRAKQKLKDEKVLYKDKTSPSKDEFTSDSSLSTNFRSFCIENCKNSESYIIRPDGD